jgi:hypothetical protein
LKYHIEKNFIPIEQVEPTSSSDNLLLGYGTHRCTKAFESGGKENIPIAGDSPGFSDDWRLE